jgi:hypothetical protein
MLSKNDFIRRLHELKKIQSKTGRATYSQVKVIDDSIQFKRDSTGNYRKIRINELYDIYRRLDHIDTINVRPYISGWKYSPACAILIAIGLFNKDGIKI